MRGAVMVLFLGLVQANARAADPSPILFPPQRLPLVFTHAKHLAKGIACDFCHEKAPTSRLSSDNLIPEEEVCAICHPIDRESEHAGDRESEHTGAAPADAGPTDGGAGAAAPRRKKHATPCGFCHVRVEERVVIPAPHLHFDHKVHVDRSIACTTCHGDLRGVDLATRAQLPKMPLCLTCHNSRRGARNAPSRCPTCHLVNPDSTLKTDLPTGLLRPSGTLRGDAHSIDFRTHHSAVAREDEAYCANCHRRDFCQSCHNGVQKPLDFHGNDYISRHPIDARKNDPNCGTCHRAQTFCLGCHERLGVVDVATYPGGPFTPAGAKRFHPEGWADPTAAGQPAHHAWQAQRNLKQCVSCHRQETCLECHGSRSGAGQRGKMQVDPHPPGWSASSRCSAMADRNRRMCLVCHGASDPHLSCR
jgi:hypothetical protein